jgi:hypothetical protein
LEIDQIINTSWNNVKQFRKAPDKSAGKGKVRIPITLTSKEIEYLDFLICHFREIVIACPDEIRTYKQKFDNIIPGSEMSKKHKDFKDELIIRMGYSKHRENYYPAFFQETGIKACVYCNSQLAVSVKNTKNKKSAKFQVDHFLPKSEFPCFSISFFNLIPVCGPCNNKKSANAVDFNFYSINPDDLKESPFEFYLDKKSLVKYRVNGNLEELEIKFLDRQNRRFNENFDIEGIYNTQKDLAEELILKSMIYNKEHLKSLQNSFKKLYPNRIPMVERLIVGNYIDPKEIHKRPLSKFTQDIAKQLKLI